MASTAFDLKPTVSEKANLRQTVEWVAFGLEPLTAEYDKAFRQQNAHLVDINTDEENQQKIISAQRLIFIALREGHLPCKGLLELDVAWENNYPHEDNDFVVRNDYNWTSPSQIPREIWEYDKIFWDLNTLLYKSDDAEDRTGKGWFAATDIEIRTEELFNIFPKQDTTEQKHPLSKNPEPSLAPLWIEFSDISGEIILNGLFVLASPTVNGQNYRIIKYLMANTNRFVSADELINKALDGKNLDKRLTDFAAQINMNKDLGRLFFDTGNDCIRLNSPVTAERMAELNIRRVRIKPA
jgi:hypothetical protein